MENQSHQDQPGSSQWPPDESIETDEVVLHSPPIQDTKNKFKFRYMMQFLVFYGMFLVYAMRTNLSITILAMVTNNTDNSTDDLSLSLQGNSTRPDVPVYPWDESMRGWLLQAFFMGYILTQIPGGYLAESVSVKWVFGYGIFLTACLTILSEAAVRIDYSAFFVLRVLEGVCEGVTYPSLYALCARWSPVTERSWMAGVANIGTIIGTVVAAPLSAWLCESAWGWPGVFYVTGGLGVVWGLMWYLLATSTPEKCRWMSEEEKSYIVNTRGVLNFENRKNRKVPWKALLSSRAVWVISICKFTNSFIFYIFLTEIPSYLKYIFDIDIQKNGYISSASYMGNAVVSLISSWSSDVFIARNPAKITRVRKSYECTAQFLGALTIGIIPFLGGDKQAIVAILILNTSVNGLTAGGDVAIPIDIGPSQAGAIQGFANTISNIAGVLAPLLVGYMTKQNETKAAWNAIFVITAAISLAGSLIFLIWGSAEVEEWAKDEEQDTSRLVEEGKE
ncbi:sialin [Galendromus occidentalis]|uniref:Sialin n=1 Tax=Galendromus occidentalis TaxID=34638 RepID=A0AAJ6QWF6_9ACAR|nr:sialin [Galendromus occidentalis]